MPRKLKWTLDESMRLPKTRGEAIAKNERYYFTGKPCSNGHLAPRRFDGKCIDCIRKTNRNRMRRLANERRGETIWTDGHSRNIIDLDELIRTGLPESRMKAKELNSKYYFTGQPCINGHLSPRRTLGGCLLCSREKQRVNAVKRREIYRQEAEAIPSRPHRDRDHRSYSHGLSRKIEQLLYNSAQGRARRKGVEFAIGVTDIIIPTHCPILGIELSKVWGNVKMNNRERTSKPTLDRIDPRKGYVPGNVIVVSYRANMIKGDGLPAEHRAIANYILEMERSA